MAMNGSDNLRLHWRTMVIFRYLSLAGSTAQLLRDGPHYLHPDLAWALLGLMLAWSLLTTWAYPRTGRWTWPLLTADLTVTLACVLADRPLAVGMPRLTGWWPAAVVVAWSVAHGWRWGTVAGGALIIVGVALPFHDGYDVAAATALMLLASITVGHIDRQNAINDRRLREAVALEAAGRERERLALDLHDSVLQVLGLIARRGAELGGDAAELGRLAADQERVLRQVITRTAQPQAGRIDLAAAVRQRADRYGAVVSDPGTGTWLPAEVVHDIVAALTCALDNVIVHCGPEAKAWVLLEDDPDAVHLTIQDNGPGIAPDRLAEAEAEGRLGIARSIHGRITALGGDVVIDSDVGEGTCVRLRVPRE
jgi:signal transduction histidine kinase